MTGLYITQVNVYTNMIVTCRGLYFWLGVLHFSYIVYLKRGVCCGEKTAKS